MAANKLNIFVVIYGYHLSMKLYNLVLLLVLLSCTTHATTYTVTHASGTNDYRPNNTIYYINGVSSVTPLTLTRGETYTFDYSSAAAANHPLFFQSIENGGAYSQLDLYTSGVTESATNQWTWTIPDDAPDILWYVCRYHSGMGGTIQIQSASTPTQQVPLPLWYYVVLAGILFVISSRALGGSRTV